MIEKNWNSEWTFWKRLDSFALTSSAPADAAIVTLPHDAMLLEKPYAESENGTNTGFHDGGVYAYEKKLFVSEEQADDTFYLKLEGVYMNALVYVNGALVSHRPYGYSTTYIPLHQDLIPGTENTIRVEARNSARSNSRWYTGSGIYRDVYLLHAGTAFFVPDTLRIETKSVSDDTAYLEIRTDIQNRSCRRRHLSVRLNVRDASGEIAASVTRPLPVFSQDVQSLRTRIVLKNAKLWSDETPNLYNLAAELLENDTVIDESRETFGVRTMTMDAENGLRINGRSVKLRGACVHHDNGLLGAATHEQAEYRRIYLLKKAGFNAIRMSHNPMSQAMLRACDALGVYVMDETFDMWTRCKGDNDYALYFDKWWKEDLEAMIRKDFNHPSVIIYSLGNEIPEFGTDRGVEVLRKLNETAKALDATRYTTAAINGVFAVSDEIGIVVGDILSSLPEEERPSAEGGNVNLFMTIMDKYMDEIVTHPLVSKAIDSIGAAIDAPGYNYMTGRYELDQKNNPDRVIIGSETCPPEISRNWDLMKTCTNVVGDFTWTGWDYIGEAGVGVPAYHFGEGGFGAQFPCQLSFVGDLDICGFRRPASYYREIVFGLRKDPYIAVQEPSHYGEHLIKTNWVISDSQSSWTWPGFEEKPIIAEVYSAAPEVELFLNDISLGRQKAGSETGYIARFELTYQPGTLTAVDYDGETELGRHTICTAGEAVLAVQEEEAYSSGNLHYYTIEKKDANGVTDTSADFRVSVEVENGTLVGLGTGNPKPTGVYTDSFTDSWNGRAQAIVLSDSTPILHVAEIKKG
ncbi:MAG: glycoside hydrolase family 2 TIM barrel-domain containing protein [Eubacteriales bacterium]|nr:glycoside hydrolase family 2 TIM barrel-domain containing protein [Eubacteriales bacterium]